MHTAGVIGLAATWISAGLLLLLLIACLWAILAGIGSDRK